MGFIFDKKKPLDFPPPPPPLGQKVEERCDRFGLPLLPLPFLCSDYEVENARLDAMLNTLIADAAETAIRHVGRRNSETVFESDANTVKRETARPQRNRLAPGRSRC